MITCPLWSPSASHCSVESRLNLMNQSSVCGDSRLRMVVKLLLSSSRTVTPSSSSSGPPSLPGRQHTRLFSQDLDRTKSPNQRQQST